ncbi:MAG: hypothetical protein HY815_24505, partial [Candidatus Riflebacteria bacterium]|nr:hypothetical protein [Candidatus Riflebacteria bacterium]
NAYRAYQSSNSQGAGTYQGNTSGMSDGQYLQSLYAQKKQELEAVPWWKFWEKSKIKNDLAMIEDLYQRQMSVEQAMAPAAPAAPAAPETGDVASDIAKTKTYDSVVDSLKAQELEAARERLKVMQEEFERRKAAKTKGPASER